MEAKGPTKMIIPDASGSKSKTSMHYYSCGLAVNNLHIFYNIKLAHSTIYIIYNYNSPCGLIKLYIKIVTS